MQLSHVDGVCQTLFLKLDWGHLRESQMACGLLIPVLVECYKYSFPTIMSCSLAGSPWREYARFGFILPYPFYHQIEKFGSRIE